MNKVMPNIKNIIFSLFLVLLFAGCGSGQEEMQDEQFTELPEYNLEQVQELAGHGDLILGQPTYTEIDSDGNHLVMDLGSTEIHVFDSNGSYQTSFGRKGDGPGEMQQPRRPVLSEQDTLYISDNIRRALIVYSRSGSYSWVHEYDISFPATEEGYPYYSLTPTEEGYPIVYTVNDDSDEFPNGYTTVKLINRSGEMIRDTGVTFNSGEMLEINMNNTQLRLGLSEISSNELAPHPGGSYFQAWTGEPILNKFSYDGDSLDTIELNGYPSQPVTSEAISAIAENYGGMFGDLENDLSEAIGDFFPAFSQMLIMKDHSIWLRRITPAESGQSWYHLSADGQPLGILNLAENESLRNAVSDHVYVSGEADDGSPVILKYRISADEV